MKIAVCVSVLLVVLFRLSAAVTVTEGHFQFSLEAVKVLRTLFPEDQASAEGNLQEMETEAASVCSHPDLPEEFQPLCVGSDGAASMSRLVLVSRHPDACEICESVACTGC